MALRTRRGRGIFAVSLRGTVMINFSWVVPEQLAGGSRPGWLGEPRQDLEFLWARGVRAIIGFTEPGVALDYAAAPDVEFETLVFEVEDHTAPPPEVLGQGLAFIDSCRSRGLPVLVHCLAGIGRTGTLLACFLARAEGLDGDGALARLRALRPHSVETLEQEDAVRRFASSPRS